MEQWLKCNSCFSGLDRNFQFWLTSCGHVFCKKCLDLGGKQCSYCKMTKISSMPLTNSAKPEVKYIFKPLEDNFEKLCMAYSFQNTQTKIALDRLLQIEKKYNLMRAEYVKIYEENKCLRDNLKAANEKFNQYFIVKSLQGSLPGTTPVSSADREQKEARLFCASPSPKVETQVQNNYLLVAETPANQRLQTLNVAPVKAKKQKARKRIGQRQ